MFRWPVALEPIVQDSDGRLGAFDELAERVAVEDQHAGDAVAPVVGGRFAADLIDFGGAASRQLADVEQGEDGLVVAVGGWRVHRSVGARASSRRVRGDD